MAGIVVMVKAEIAVVVVVAKVVVVAVVVAVVVVVAVALAVAKVEQGKKHWRRKDIQRVWFSSRQVNNPRKSISTSAWMIFAV